MKHLPVLATLILLFLVSVLSKKKTKWDDIDVDALEKQWEEGDDIAELTPEYKLQEEQVNWHFE